MTVRPDTSTGLTYLWLAVDPALEVDDNHEVSGGPAGQNVRLDSGTTLVMMFSEQSRTARIEGLRVDWSYGETGGYQVLPLTVRATATGCTASVETDH